MREKLAINAATAMIGTAFNGPKTMINTGISMIEEPKPTMPPMVPAMRPMVRTRAYSIT